MIKRIVWKEWREQRWKLAFGCALLMGLCTISLRSRVMSDGATFGLVFLVGGLLLPLFAAMGCIGQDREEGSSHYLMSLPVGAGSLLLIKTAIGLLVWLVPLLGAFVVSLALAGGREWTTPEIRRWYTDLILIAVILQVWTQAFGITQPSEARIGLVGLMVIILWLAVATKRDLAYLCPFTMLERRSRLGEEQAALCILVHGMLLIPLWFLAWRRFSRIGGRKP